MANAASTTSPVQPSSSTDHTTQTSASQVQEPNSPTTKTSFWETRPTHLIQFYLTKAIAIILMLQGLRALYSSISFIFIEMPHLEQKLALNQIAQTQVNGLANKAIIMTVSTILSLFFALRITVIQSKVAQRLNTFIGILLIIGNSQITNLLNQIGSTRLLTSVIIDSFRSIIIF